MSPSSAFADAFPNSTKVLVDAPQGVRVPMREIALTGGEAPLRVYDTSGPQGHDVTSGLPKLREPWVNARLRSRAASSDAAGASITSLQLGQQDRPKRRASRGAGRVP